MSRFKEGQEALLKDGNEWLKGVIERFGEELFFVRDGDSVIIKIEADSIIIPDATVDVKLLGVKRKFRRRAEHLGMTLSAYAEYCMSIELTSSKATVA